MLSYIIGNQGGQRELFEWPAGPSLSPSTFLCFMWISPIPVYLLALSVIVAKAAAPYCIPWQSCFPSRAQLAAFNSSIGAALLASPPYAAVW
ncbi:hypothetical protein B0H10DRAFT_1977208 [Mycena sp. CBHHK59/15]|nr:hypothetical protein B0H10DRAFT_1977208 [Mycena sp. CBHHK59/15]